LLLISGRRRGARQRHPDAGEVQWNTLTSGGAMGSKHLGFLYRVAVAALGLAALMPGSATAGPPFRTDDPGVVDYQHWEFYTFSTGTEVSDDTSGIGPAWEFNYGILPNAMLHVIAPLAFDSPAGGPSQFGYGDTEIGFKYRFVEQKKNGLIPSIALFPLVEVPTGDQERGLGAGHATAFLPVWIEWDFGDWTTYGGGGYWFNKNDNFGDKDYGFVGWLLQRKVTEKLVIGGEVFYQTADAVDGVDEAGFNIGAIYDFDEHNHFLVSAGRGFLHASETNLFSWYVGYQVTY
jgi:hypothetical protein